MPYEEDKLIKVDQHDLNLFEIEVQYCLECRGEYLCNRHGVIYYDNFAKLVDRGCCTDENRAFCH